jgi:hypothetical protein
MSVTREQIIHLLTEAAEIEHNLLCSYLYAAFSLKSAPGDGLRTVEAEAVERWRNSIMSVAIEEMSHLALVNNLLVALGGAPHFGRPNLPVPPGYHPAEFVIRLTPFDEATLDHFIFLERPEGSRLGDSAEFEPSVEKRRVPPARRITPSANDYETIGEFYGDIRQGVTALAERHGSGLFPDSCMRGQMSPEIVTLPGLMTIGDLKSALEALDTIVEQGEGSRGDREDCHFARFKAIRREWADLVAANPGFIPAHPAAADPVMRRPLVDEERVWVTALPAAPRLDLANAIYAETLILLVQTYSSEAPTSARKGFAAAAMTLMRAMGQLGTALARLPASEQHADINAGMTFAVPRNLGLRAATSAVPVFVERLAELREACLAAGAPELVPVLREAEGVLAALRQKEPA